jgi:hypothetical protein
MGERRVPDPIEPPPMVRSTIEGSAGVAAGAAAGPAAGVAATAVTGELVGRALDWINRHRTASVEKVLAKAAELEHMDVVAMANRLRDLSPDHYELLIDTVELAARLGDPKRLVAAAKALSESANIEPGDPELDRRRAIVSALDVVTPARGALLRVFTKTATDLGLGREHDTTGVPVHHLNRVQLERVVVDEASVLDADLQALSSRGLIRPFSAQGGFTSGAGLTDGWEITDLGIDVIARLDTVADVI